MSDSIPQSERVFHEAIRLPREERLPFLERECRDDACLRSELVRLLASHERNEGDDFILERPIAESVEDNIAEIAESEGDTIGRYRLLEQIGEGGMGLVYMAEQTDDVRRRVALKIIKLGMDTRQLIARFEAERQAMALFDHPNITRMLDAGSTSTGRPYFVMELVRGVSITDYVQSNILPLADRLRLFAKVCRAVHHAHQKGVIHRDLKPSNILVTQYDGVPVPKVIDFGIAKAIGQQQLTEKTLFTRFTLMVGTPQYMSPEQAEMTGLDIDTRADIYSLGVILYELVTGSTPLAAKELKQLNPLALYETLRDADIETPSLRLSRLQGMTDSGGSKSPIPQPISVPPERLKDDLDWIVMKAIARNRRERYASAAAVAADVERFLAGDPVEAAPPSRSYVLKTLAKKYRTVAVSALAFTVVLLVSVVTCSWLAVRNYRTSQRLASSNRELSATVDRLQIAEANIRASALNERYGAAISMAFLRYDMEVMREVHSVLNRTLVQDPPKRSDPDDANQVPSRQGGSGFGIEVVPSRRYAALFEFRQTSLLRSSLKPINDWLSREQQFSSVLQDEFPQFDFGAISKGVDGAVGPPFPPNVVDVSPGDFDFTAQWEESKRHSELAVKKLRHRFFRLLLAEYRRVFGERSPRVAEALNLLAACLMDCGESDEADARLRESLVLAEGDERTAAAALLKIVSNTRDRLPGAGSRPTND